MKENSKRKENAEIPIREQVRKIHGIRKTK